MLNKANIKDIYLLSPLQEGMLFHALYDKNSSAYFEQSRYSISGHLDLACFEYAWNEVMKQHDALRTVFVYGKTERPLQVVLKERQVGFSYKDIRYKSLSEQEAYINRYREEDRHNLFDLTKDVLMRLHVFQTQDSEYTLIWSHHHILMDGWCQGIIQRDFLEIYTRLIHGERMITKFLPPYSHYIKWLEKKDKAESLAFWKRYLTGFDQPSLVPGRLSTNPPHDFEQAMLSFILDRETTSRLSNMAAASQVTANIFLQCVWAVLLGIYNNTQDVVFGMTVAGRPAEIDGIEQMVGLFINAVPVRIKMDARMGFSDLLASVKEQSLLAENHHHCSLAEIQANSELKQNLIDHMMIYENFPAGLGPDGSTELPACGFEIDCVDVFEQTHYNFCLTVLPGEEIRFNLTYNSKFYDDAQIASVEGHVKKIIHTVLNDRNAPIHELEIVTDREKNRLLHDFGRGADTVTATRTLQDLFEAQVEKSFDARAVVCGNDTLSYDALNKAANKIAFYLRRQVLIRPDGVVALMLDRSVAMVAGILGILKSGGAYLPIDPELPAPRINDMLTSSQAKALLIHGELPDGVNMNGPVIDLRDERIASCEDHNLPVVNQPGDLAYTIFTSGSTGRPKGVMIEHHSVLNLVQGLQRVVYTHHGAALKVALLASSSFDASVQQIFAALLYGHCLHVIETALKQDVDGLIRYFNRQQIEIADCTPSLLSIILSCELWNTETLFLKHLLVGGEVFPVDLADRFFKSRVSDHCQVLNVYGPTECCVDALAHPVTRSDRAVIAVGKPLDGHDIFILDDHLRLAPVGIPGEIYIGGRGVGRGYLNLTSETSTAFMTSPFDASKRLYKTGDLGKWLPDGNVVYCGRRDNQLKVRGYRIEAGEIESVLEKHDAVTKAVVVMRTTREHHQDLVAYIVSEKNLTPSMLRDFLSQYLPSYMFPDFFVPIESVPLTASAKVDVKALPDPVHVALSEGANLDTPENEMEQTLLSAWKQVLGLGHLGVRNHFFDVGGHSLKAMQLVSLLARTSDLELRISDIFQYPTVKELARHLLQCESGGGGRLGKYIVPLSPVQSGRQHVVLLPPALGTSTFYKKFTELLWDDLNYFGIECKGFETDEPFCETVESLVEHFTEQIKTVSPDGPLIMIGYSMGVSIALEVAEKMEKSGQTTTLILIDGSLRSIDEKIDDHADHSEDDANQFWETSLQTARKSLSNRDLSRLASLVAHNRNIFDQYVYTGRINSNVYCFEAANNSIGTSMIEIRERTSGKFSRDYVPGNHHTLFQEPFIHGLARLVLEKSVFIRRSIDSV